jgi:hypothetical protein
MTAPEGTKLCKFVFTNTIRTSLIQLLAITTIGNSRTLDWSLTIIGGRHLVAGTGFFLSYIRTLKSSNFDFCIPETKVVNAALHKQ